MRVLLDTNVWRYLVDARYENTLFQSMRHSGKKITVAPGVVIETLRMSNPAIRKKIVELQTRDCWERLMPDAFLECEDVKSEMLRTHPEWALKVKNINLFRKLRYDWIRSKGGFWDKTRNQTESVISQYKRQDSSSLTKVREQSRAARSSVVESGNRLLNTNSLNDFKGSYRYAPTGEKVVVDAWRVYAATIWGNMLSHDSAFKQWIGCEIDIDFILSFGALDFVKFWEIEANAESLPREWIRAAVYFLQSEKKVTDGNPSDAAILVHAVDVDLIVSADKNFISMLNRIQDEAPFRTAHGILIQAGKIGADELMHLLSESTTLLTAGSNTRH